MCSLQTVEMLIVLRDLNVILEAVTCSCLERRLFHIRGLKVIHCLMCTGRKYDQQQMVHDTSASVGIHLYHVIACTLHLKQEDYYIRPSSIPSCIKSQ